MIVDVCGTSITFHGSTVIYYEMVLKKFVDVDHNPASRLWI